MLRLCSHHTSPLSASPLHLWLPQNLWIHCLCHLGCGVSPSPLLGLLTPLSLSIAGVDGPSMKGSHHQRRVPMLLSRFPAFTPAPGAPCSIWGPRGMPRRNEESRPGLGQPKHTHSCCSALGQDSSQSVLQLSRLHTQQYSGLHGPHTGKSAVRDIGTCPTSKIYDEVRHLFRIF